MTYSFESPKVFDKLLIPEESPLRRTVTISNPLGEDFSIMRTLPLNGMLTSLSTNYNRRNKEVRLYELANIYLPKALPLTELPDERMQFVLGMYGSGDFFAMKGVVEEFFEKVGMDKKVHYDPNGDHPYLHPGPQGGYGLCRERLWGYLGEIHPQVAENYKIGERTYVAVVDMPAIMEYTTFDRKYKGLARFPAVTRDLSMVVPKDVRWWARLRMCWSSGAASSWRAITSSTSTRGPRCWPATSPWRTPSRSGQLTTRWTIRKSLR